MNNSDNQFIDNLANQLEPGRFWRPSWRALAWGPLVLILNIAIMLAVQAFRPNFGQQLLQYWRFSLEIFSATLLTSFLIYTIFNDLVPGKKLKPFILALGTFSLLVFLFSLTNGFFKQSPPTTTLGARPFCVEEVFLYGLIGASLFYYFIHKAHFNLSRTSYFVVGLTTGLIPGTLMQLSCMYSPWHGVLLHYLPAVVGGAVTCLVLPVFKK